MKRHLLSLLRGMGVLPATAVLAAATLLSTAFPCSAQGNSPVGKWDFVLGGSGQQGLAVIEFFDDGFGNRTFSGYGILVPKVKGTGGDVSERGPDPGRGTSDTNSPSSQTNVFLFGYAEFDGHWNFDASGRIIGGFSIEVEESFGSTNTSLYSVSFTGKAVPGRRLTLVASTEGGRVIYRGIPYGDLTDLSSGVWNGIKTENNQMFVELFVLQNRLDNSYEMFVQPGPTYTYLGVSMVSAHKKIAFALEEIPLNAETGFLRSSFGPYRETATKSTARTKGIKEPDIRFKFDAVKATPVLQ